MRLLYYNSDGDFSLTEFFESNIPKYAILSHRWGAKEVTLADLTDGTRKKMACYGKVQFCGEQALHNGLHYFWVDTCCIDKSNAVELQEAINSMFRWSQNAVKCYVYLSDIPKRKREASDRFSDKWFTRGWTLQELIAPKSVVFFSKDWEQLERRETTRKEDQAYSLLGVFDVYMPLIYSEGEEHAWPHPRFLTL
ncbi:heterokaryon incompatibility protein-domain-containing protein [Cadophora sp. MPI-SDFR-AT-0126]|nr:heterokaryon incompatibility protein-domain-containing protein [Leotiomycetes sp. MPI-SDFR-AT-0126]